MVNLWKGKTEKCRITLYRSAIAVKMVKRTVRRSPGGIDSRAAPEHISEGDITEVLLAMRLAESTMGRQGALLEQADHVAVISLRMADKHTDLSVASAGKKRLIPSCFAQLGALQEQPY